MRRRQQLPKGVLRGCAECADCQKVRLIMLNCWSCFSGDVFSWIMHITSCRLLQGGIHLVHRKPVLEEAPVYYPSEEVPC